MAEINKVNLKHFYHCFKLSDVYYALFDEKVDMPIAIESLPIIKTVGLPLNSYIFYYEMHDGYFQKPPEKLIDIKGNAHHQKPPLRFRKLDNKQLFYHHFKISPVLSVLFDDQFDMPIVHGSNQKVQATISQIKREATIFYYKEDVTLKPSFKLYMTYRGKKPQNVQPKPDTKPEDKPLNP